MTRACMEWDVPEDREGEPTCHDWYRTVQCEHLLAQKLGWRCELFGREVVYDRAGACGYIRPCQRCRAVWRSHDQAS